MSAQGTGGPTQQGGPWRTVGLGLVGLSPFAIAGSIFTPTIREYPLWSVAVIVVSIWPVGFVMRVAGELVNRWVPRAADRVERGLGRHRKRYLESLHEHVRHLEVLGVATQGEFTLRLGDVYVDVALVPKSASDSGPGNITRESLTQAIENSESGVVAVIGGPGSGKTTLLRHQTLSLCLRKRAGLPILLEIRQHAARIVADDPGIADLAASTRAPKEWLEARLRDRDCVVLLDGLDEVADEDDRRRVVGWLRAQISAHPGNRFVITSRPYGYDGNPLPGADRVEVQPFTDPQIERFLHAWYEAVERRSANEEGPAATARAQRGADFLLGRLREHRPLLDFASSPLLLTMIALVHRYRGALPGTRAKLYEEMCAVLLHRRREAKQLTGGVGLSGEQKERVARVLARSMMEHGERDVKVADALDAIRPALSRMRPVTAAAEFLREAVHSGLLVEPREGAYAFAHLTLQEYLTAADVRDNGEQAWLFEHIDIPWWRETILLWAAGSDVSELVEDCVRVGTPDAAMLASECITLGREVGGGVLQRFADHVASLDERLLREHVISTWGTAAQGETALLGPVPALHLRALLGEEFTAASAHHPAKDVPRKVAASFPDMLSVLLPGGPRFRLPTAAEMERGAAYHPGTSAVWVQGESGPELWCPGDVRHPFRVTREALMSVLRADGAPEEVKNRFPEELPAAFADDLSPFLNARLDLAGEMFEPMNRHVALQLQAEGNVLLSSLAIMAIPTDAGAEGSAARARLQALQAVSRAEELRSMVVHGGPGFPATDLAVLSEFRWLFMYALSALAVDKLRSDGVIEPNEILVLARD